MIRSDFFYNLPKELIAQHPAIPRDSSKLLCLDKK
ncbi:MAG: S-adenosylmethionine:tRNA ribosyltransferase-isomerase, partial [Oscillospiraceae bacterium]